MRIGIDASSLPASIAGAGRYIRGLIQGLADIDCRNEYFIFIKTKDAHSFVNLPESFKLVHLSHSNRPLRLAWQHCVAGARAQQLQLDIWHSPHYCLPSFINNVGLVVTFHDMGVFLYPQLYPAAKRLYFRQAITHAANIADSIITVSQTTANDLHRLVEERVVTCNELKQKTQPILSGIDMRFFCKAAEYEIEQVKQRYNISKRYLLFLGTSEKRKNLTTLITAFRKFVDRGHRDHSLILAGQNSNAKKEIRETISRLDLADQVNCIGYVDERELPALYQGADLFVMPSIYEGFGFPLLEAMAGGVVSLAANTSSLRELSANPKMLCANEPDEWAVKIEMSVFDANVRQELIECGQTRARQFSWKTTAENVLNVYEKVYRKNRRSFSTINTNGVSTAASKNGAAKNSHRKVPAQTSIQNAVLRTLCYADLFDYPLKAAEAHYGLFEADTSYYKVIQTLEELRNKHIAQETDGYYYLSPRKDLVRLRKLRRQHSREIVARNHRLLTFIKKFPFIRCVAISGTLAFENCQPKDDIDLFLIVENKRLWMVYLLLAFLLKLTGKRRLLCLNCLIGTNALEIDDRDFFVAHQIAFLLPISGYHCLKKFFKANKWCKEFLPQFNAERRIDLIPAYFDLTDNDRGSTKIVEFVLKLKPFDWVESLIFHCYRWHIKRITKNIKTNSIVANRDQIKLFPNDHRYRLIKKLNDRARSVLSKLNHKEKVQNHVPV